MSVQVMEKTTQPIATFVWHCTALNFTASWASQLTTDFFFESVIESVFSSLCQTNHIIPHTSHGLI